MGLNDDGVFLAHDWFLFRDDSATLHCFIPRCSRVAMSNSSLHRLDLEIVHCLTLDPTRGQGVMNQFVFPCSFIISFVHDLQVAV